MYLHTEKPHVASYTHAHTEIMDKSTHREAKAVPFSTYTETESGDTGVVLRIIDATQRHYPFPRVILIKVLGGGQYWYAEVETTLVFTRCYDKEDLRNFIVQNLNYPDLFVITPEDNYVGVAATSTEDMLWMLNKLLPLDL